MKIYLVRHGQSEWQLNPSDDWDTPLTDLGYEQAKRLGEWLGQQQCVDHLSGVKVASLCASPSKRAMETAAYAAAGLGMPFTTELKLREADFHVAEHLPTWQTPLEPLRAHALSDRYASFRAQVHEALQWLVQQAETSGGPVLAVTHGGLIKTLLRLVSGSDYLSFRLYNTGVNLIEWHRVRWHLVHLNRWDHLSTDLRSL